MFSGLRPFYLSDLISTGPLAHSALVTLVSCCAWNAPGVLCPDSLRICAWNALLPGTSLTCVLSSFMTQTSPSLKLYPSQLPSTSIPCPSCCLIFLSGAYYHLMHQLFSLFCLWSFPSSGIRAPWRLGVCCFDLCCIASIWDRARHTVGRKAKTTTTNDKLPWR